MVVTKCYNSLVSFESPPNPFVPDEDLVRRTSRTVLHAAERGRKTLFEKLTAENEGKIAELMQRKPVFYENKDDSPQEILLDPEIADLMPPEFFENPTEWIESQENIERGYDEPGKSIPKGREINELWEQPYDVSKVKEIGVAKPNGDIVVFVSKRIDPTQLEEIFLAREAYEAGIPTPKVLGEIVDHGNVYAFFEKINALSLDSIKDKTESRQLGVFSWSEEQSFLADNREAIFGHDFPERLEKKFKSIFKGASKDYVLFDLADILSGYILDPNIPSAALRGQLKNFSSETLRRRTEHLIFFGFSNWSDVFALMDGPLEERIKKALELKKSLELYRKKLWKYELTLKKEIQLNNFGYEPKKEIEKLKRLCQEKGIKHKDFNNRNILIDWDYENNKPKKGPDGKAKMYLIDWEPEPKSKSNE